MSESDSPDTGLTSSVGRAANSLFALVHNRVSLFAIEFQAERLRAMDRLFWLAIGLALCLIGLVVGTVVLSFYLWQTTGYIGLVILAVVFLVAGALVLLRLRGQLQKAPRPFADTLAEFEKDRACLRDQN